MGEWPFCFIHAGDLELDRVPSGMADVPDHLRETILDATFVAAERVFDTVVAHDAQFLLLTGNACNPLNASPRTLLFLVGQFRRLAERKIPVYWAMGQLDAAELWPAWLTLPENVRVFGRGRVDDWVHERDGVPLARLLGTSVERGRAADIDRFDRDPTGLITIGVLGGPADSAAIRRRGLHYWALGGQRKRTTLPADSSHAVFCGSPQGIDFAEAGPHGCTLVMVDEKRQVRTSFVPTDVFRWCDERVGVDETTTRLGLEQLLRDRVQALTDSAPDRVLLIQWSIVGSGPLMRQMRNGSAAGDLLQWLRTEFGFAAPARWPVAVDVRLAAELPVAWYEQDTILGDFLREVRRFEMNPQEPLVLAQAPPGHPLAAVIDSVSVISDPGVRAEVLREAAILGSDLLGPEEAGP